MNHASLRRAIAALVGVVALTAVTASAASAATISPGATCARYLPGMAGEQWVPISGSGFSPNADPSSNSVELHYDTPDRDLGGFVPAAPDGSFSTGVFMPTEFIRTETGRTKTYTLTATDRLNPALVASTNVTFVRVGADVKPARVPNNVSRKVRWSVWGPRTGTRVFVHWTFKGRRLATRKLGTAKGACGIAHKRLPFLPVAPRTGTWKVYITAGKRMNKKRALFRIDVNVFRTFRSSAASVRVR